jgi:general secretion pathway protein D
VLLTERGRQALVLVLAAGLLSGQQQPVLPPGFSVPNPNPLQQATPPPQPAAPRPQQPGQPTPTAQTPSTPPNPALSTPPTAYGGLALNNASLTEVLDLLARQLKLNYILDPRVKGGVILNTYGDIKDIDPRSLLETILRINGYGMVKQGDLFRIVPLNEISHQPMPPQRLTDSKDIPEDDQTMLNLVFLKYVTADELSKVLTPFQGENSSMYTYPPANLLLILDSRRNMRRLMDLVGLFDNDALANQRVHLFEVKHGRPVDIAKELDGIMKAISLSDKNSPVKFIPIDRINTIIAVAPNPGSFVEVGKWLDKLDVPVRLTAGAVANYVYRLKYGDAQSIGCSITALFGSLNSNSSSQQNSIGACAGFGQQFGANFGNMYNTGLGNGINGGGSGAAGFNGGGSFNGGGGGYNTGGGYNNGGGYGQNGYGTGAGGSPFGGGAPVAGATSNGQPAAGTNLTGLPLGNANLGGDPNVHVPKVIPNPYNNTILIQATPQEYESILSLLRELDVPPRQVLIEAKIYEVDISNQLSASVSYTLQAQSTSANRLGVGAVSALAGLTFNQGWVVDASRELLAAVAVQEAVSKAKMIAEPSVMATDSIPASINVGLSVPTLTATAATGVQQGGNTLFTNSVSTRDTGTTMQILARVSPSGIVTMVIDQEVSAPVAPASGAIQSPSFSRRVVTTQLTMQDGDTIAIGGIIQETVGVSSSGIPYLNRIPIFGFLFGNKSYQKARSELIIFLTPHVIYDTNQLVDAGDDLKNQMKTLKRDLKNQ